MNKTVNINLAGIFFHIDEDAYLKLQRYLEAIKRSFTDSQGRNEILADIEARIAELFSERIKDEKQVISVREVEDVITIMGQPEDYLVDEEIFEDDPQPRAQRSHSQSNRKLFRDTDNAYIAGVASGLGHYFGIDPLWIRLIWILLVVGGGFGILLYILLWILMPSAQTTADKLAMTGKPVNITNIEQKVKEGFSNVKESLDEVTDKVKNGDYTKKVKSNSRSFFDALGDVILFCFKIFAKFIGVILIIVGASTLIVLFISLFSVGTSSFFSPWWMDYVHAGNISGGPLWFISLTTFFAVGIPFFLIFLLGLKILVNNLKSIGRVAKFTLLGLWLVSVLSLSVMAIREFTNNAVNASITDKTDLVFDKSNPLKIEMAGNDNYYRSRSGRIHRNTDFRIISDDYNNKKIYSSDLRLFIRSTEDSVATLSIEKSANGRDYQNARENAGKIEYEYQLNTNRLQLNSYLLTDLKNKFKDQEVDIIIHLPIGTTFKLDRNTRAFLSGYRSSRGIISYSETGETHKVIDGDTECLDCIDDESDESKSNSTVLKADKVTIQSNTQQEEITIKTDTVEVQIDSTKI